MQFLTVGDSVVHVLEDGWSYTSGPGIGEVTITDPDGNEAVVGDEVDAHEIKIDPSAPPYLQAGCFRYDGTDFTQKLITDAETDEYKRWFEAADVNWPNIPVAALVKSLRTCKGMKLVEFLGLAAANGAIIEEFTDIWNYPDFMRRLETACEGGRVGDLQTMVAINPLRPSLSEATKDALDLAAAAFDTNLEAQLSAEAPFAIDLDHDWKTLMAYRKAGGIK